MKKSFISVLFILIVIFLILFVKFKNMRNYNLEIMKFNSDYEIYNKKELNGLDIVSAINLAMNNNEKFNVSKDENGYYDLDDIDSIEIYVDMGNDDESKIYRMESFSKTKQGLNGFIASFSEANFECLDLKYYEETHKVKSMTFRIVD